MLLFFTKETIATDASFT